MQQIDKQLKRLTQPWFIMLLVVITALSILYWDRPLAEYFYHLHLKTVVPVLGWFSNFGSAALYLAGLPVMAFIYRYVKPNKAVEMRWWFLWGCVAFCSVINFTLKVLIGRARPQLWMEQHLYGLFGLNTSDLFLSCPSGHTTTVIAMLIGLLVLLPKYRYGWILLAVCLVMTRILLAHHYLSDVLISCVLVFIELQIFFILLRHIGSKKREPSDLKRLSALVS